ncbi:hypothetical protein [Thermococcus aciditolerans]|uniref:Uncharacterized protein n=1 Tax=Thermococcus aciditolerans TaxID=2598455 RepID=A0A5C0SNM4_9EURY|nr:hypothetical protein [Thermococcus aciditolerans]QEK15960.1 hypothetical protein FPV09_09620 [Thermococcus aciditolerans]
MPRRPIVFLLVVLSVTLPLVHALPYWFQNGTYATYALKAPKDATRKEINIFEVWPTLLPEEAYEKISTVEDINNSIPISLFVRGDVLLTFRILNVTKEYARIEVTLELNDVTVDCLNCRYLKKLVLSRVLVLNLTDMMYHDENGAVLGRPTFFVDPSNPPSRGDLIASSVPLKRLEIHTQDLIVSNLSFTWQEGKVLHTYFRDFLPPYILVESNQVPFLWSKYGGSITASAMSSMVYDFDTGLMITTWLLDITPEFISLGIINGDSMNYQASRELQRLFDEGRADKEWWQPGFNLYDTNIRFLKTSSSGAPNTGMRYFFAISLALLILTAFLNWRWQRE